MLGRQRTIHLLPCGWSQDGLNTFNQLAKEICKDRKEHGETFNKAFKTSIEEDMASRAINQAGKRKRQCVDTYNDLTTNHEIMSHEDASDNEDEKWVMKNLFTV